jgi:hypothetical protein
MSKRADRRRRERHHNASVPKSVSAPARPRAPDSGSLDDRLARLLDTAPLARLVPRLAPDVLHQVIQHRGLEACGAVVAAATPRQVAALLDLDLWRTTPGRDDRFDGRRFGVWLETLMAEGEAVAARVVDAMDRDVATAGLSRYVRVFDPGIFEPTESSDDDLGGLVVTPPAGLECEVGGYTVHARTPHAWDAVVGLLVTLAEDRPGAFHELMQGCQRLSNSAPEADGFHDLMLAPEQFLYDVSLGREDRRGQQGYLSAADARAFLQMAKQTRPTESDGSSSINGIAAAYFRTLDDVAEPTVREAEHGEPTESSASDREVSESIAAVVELLAEPGIAPSRPRALLGPVEADEPRLTPIAPLMEYVHDHDQGAYVARSRELGFLANALVAGCTVHARPFTAREAWDAAVGTCNLGLEVQFGPPARSGVAAERAADLPAFPDTFLVDHGLVEAFEAGWRLLHEEVSLFIAERLIAALGDLQSVDSVFERDLYLLRRNLERNRDSGAPWRSREALEVIAILDPPAWACLQGLLSECPVVPAALTAILEGNVSSVSATAFECFTTRRQVRRVHQFAYQLRKTLLH